MEPNKIINALIQEIRKLDDEDRENVLDLISALRSTDPSQQTYGEQDLAHLQNCYEHLHTAVEFEKGQLVKWKDNLKNKQLPAEVQPAIVVEILSKPLYSQESAGTPYFQEPLDIALGVTNPNGEFLVFYYDKRRFEPYN